MLGPTPSKAATKDRHGERATGSWGQRSGHTSMSQGALRPAGHQLRPGEEREATHGRHVLPEASLQKCENTSVELGSGGQGKLLSPVLAGVPH